MMTANIVNPSEPNCANKVIGSDSDGVKVNQLSKQVERPPKLSHKKWRRLLKKERRRLLRQHEASRRQKEEEEELARIQNDPVLWAKYKAEQHAEELRKKKEQEERQRNHYEWLQKEAIAQRLFHIQKNEEKRKEEERQKQEQKIKEEWERQQKKEKEEKEKQQQANKAQEDRLNIELQKAGIIGGQGKDEDWHIPFAPTSTGDVNVASENYGTEKDQKNCSFFLKTGACRFGDRCSRHHAKLSSGQTLLIPGFFQDVRLTEPMLDEHDQDVGLEFDEKELYDNFRNFYKDVFPEFDGCGTVLQFKVCCNHEPHLRGNLYVMYKTEDEALSAFSKFNGRWYAGKQLSVQFSPVTKWKSAICGMFHKKSCPRGKNCNFLHVFRNPGNAFIDADYDYYPTTHRERVNLANSIRHENRNKGGHRREVYNRERRSHKYHKSYRSSSSKSPSPKRDSRKRSYRSKHRYSRSPSDHRCKRSRSRSRERRRRNKSPSSQPSTSSRSLRNHENGEQSKTSRYTMSAREVDRYENGKRKCKLAQRANSSSDSESNNSKRQSHRKRKKTRVLPIQCQSKEFCQKDGTYSSGSSSEWSNLEDD